MKHHYIFIGAVVCCIILYVVSIVSKADDTSYFDEPKVIRCTCYCDSGVTASGKYTREGIVAGRGEWIGCVAALYEVNEDGSIGEFIGYYEFFDTGAGIDTDGDGVGDSIRNGKSIDVYQPTLADCKEWISKYGDYVYLLVIPGNG